MKVEKLLEVLQILIITLLKEGDWSVVCDLLIYILLIYIISKEKRIEELEKKLEEIQKESVRREEYYRDISGWREEIRRLEDKLFWTLNKRWEDRK